MGPCRRIVDFPFVSNILLGLEVFVISLLELFDIRCVIEEQLLLFDIHQTLESRLRFGVFVNVFDQLLVSVIRLSEHDLLVGKILEITRKLLFEFAHGFSAIVCGAGVIRRGPVEKIQFYDLLLGVSSPFEHRILKTFGSHASGVERLLSPKQIRDPVSDLLAVRYCQRDSDG